MKLISEKELESLLILQDTLEHLSFGGELKFEKQNKRDQLLRDFCEAHKDQFILVEIPYSMKDKEIENILKETFDIKSNKPLPEILTSPGHFRRH